MSSAICTLFEGNYHFGVASLINSLHRNGFIGNIYIGYRGELPKWADAGDRNRDLNWFGAKTVIASNDLSLHFLPITCETHFTNYKPEFILDVWRQCINENQTEGIFYFDPDIVNKCNWNFYKKWVRNGVALVHEVVWNDMPPTHPKRHQWKEIADSMGHPIRNSLNSYINAGFIGVGKDQLGFVRLWKEFIDFSEINYNLNKSKFSQGMDNSELLTVADQDLLNLTAMCAEEKLSVFGPEGMDFVGGGWLMSHATGSPKPWNTNYLLEWLLKGRKPTIQSKEYWRNATGVIRSYASFNIKINIFSMKVASFLSRFYKAS